MFVRSMHRGISDLVAKIAADRFLFFQQMTSPVASTTSLHFFGIVIYARFAFLLLKSKQTNKALPGTFPLLCNR